MQQQYSKFPWFFNYHKPPSMPCGRGRRGCHCPPAVTCLSPVPQQHLCPLALPQGNVRQICSSLEQLFPKSLSCSWALPGKHSGKLSTERVRSWPDQKKSGTGSEDSSRILKPKFLKKQTHILNHSWFLLLVPIYERRDCASTVATHFSKKWERL